MGYSIYGTVSPSSLELDSSHQDSKLLELWCTYLEEHLHGRHLSADHVDIKLAPFGGTRLRATGNGSSPAKIQLETEAEEILDEFCYELETLSVPGRIGSYPKLGDPEC